MRAITRFLRYGKDNSCFRCLEPVEQARQGINEVIGVGATPPNRGCAGDAHPSSSAQVCRLTRGGPWSRGVSRGTRPLQHL